MDDIKVIRREKVAQRLLSALENAGVKQKELADHVGVSKATINQYTKGRCIPKQKTAMKIASFLNVDYFWLIGLDGNPDPDESPIDTFIESQRLSEFYTGNKEYRKLLNTAMNVNKVNIDLAVQFLEKL